MVGGFGLDQVYIVYIGSLPHSLGDYCPSSHHLHILWRVVGSAAEESLVRSYHRSFNGFAATLSEEEAQKISEMGVVSVFPSKGRMTCCTTQSWDFMGFGQHVRRSSIESDIIIGVIDGGIWPENECFSDDGFGPPPSKWKGGCYAPSGFSCNNKIVGARYYWSSGAPPLEEDVLSPRDFNGHGTHVAAIAAGCSVSGSFYGFARGNIRGGVPSARLAIYKVCWPHYNTKDIDVLDAFDDAISDGVDIINCSLGNRDCVCYSRDPIAIGSLHAFRRGILTCVSAGNLGPAYMTLNNRAPWALVVASTYTARKYSTILKLGNGKEFEGTSINTFDLEGKQYPLVNEDEISSIARNLGQKLDEEFFAGKIILRNINPCELVGISGELGVVLYWTKHDGGICPMRTFPCPAVFVDAEDAAEIICYIKTNSNPTCTISRSEEVQGQDYPIVNEESSRGPFVQTLDILQPDISAPGVAILSAWSDASSVTTVGWDSRFSSYNIVSGTSMSCPHVSAVAAYVKTFYPHWSPAAIKSALMTTALPMKEAEIQPHGQAEFAYGAGFLAPTRAVDPGLVYDMDIQDFEGFLCREEFDYENLELLLGDENVCSTVDVKPVWDLNFPSLTLHSVGGHSVTRVFKRTLTNVGMPATYKLTVNAPPGTKVEVSPNVLEFTSTGEKKSFEVMVTAQVRPNCVCSGSLIWGDGVHSVRSPIVAHALEKCYR